MKDAIDTNSETTEQALDFKSHLGIGSKENCLLDSVSNVCMAST